MKAALWVMKTFMGVRTNPPKKLYLAHVCLSCPGPVQIKSWLSLEGVKAKSRSRPSNLCCSPDFTSTSSLYLWMVKLCACEMTNIFLHYFYTLFLQTLSRDRVHDNTENVPETGLELYSLEGACSWLFPALTWWASFPFHYAVFMVWIWSALYCSWIHCSGTANREFGSEPRELSVWWDDFRRGWISPFLPHKTALTVIHEVFDGTLYDMLHPPVCSRERIQMVFSKISTSIGKESLLNLLDDVCFLRFSL